MDSSIFMKDRWIFFVLAFLAPLMGRSEDISPYKFTDKEGPFVEYTIPASSRFLVPRLGEGAPDIVFYFSPPQKDLFPIAILCGGSLSQGSLFSEIQLHRYFLQELWDLGLGVLTLERWGIDGSEIDEKEFFAHYTRSQRLRDLRAVIQYVEKNPPAGWDGRFVFIGVSEGGPLVTELSTLYSNAIATINWCGAGDWSWADEFWQFFQDCEASDPFPEDVPRSRLEYDLLVKKIIQNPMPDEWMGGMTYLYHADAFQTPSIDYSKIQSPFLVVAGTEDSAIESSDQFVEKATALGAPITYFRVEGMDHYVRRRPDVLQDSFAWLQKQL